MATKTIKTTHHAKTRINVLRGGVLLSLILLVLGSLVTWSSYHSTLDTAQKDLDHTAAYLAIRTIQILKEADRALKKTTEHLLTHERTLIDNKKQLDDILQTGLHDVSFLHHTLLFDPDGQLLFQHTYGAAPALSDEALLHIPSRLQPANRLSVSSLHGREDIVLSRPIMTSQAERRGHLVLVLSNMVLKDLYQASLLRNTYNVSLTFGATKIINLPEGKPDTSATQLIALQHIEPFDLTLRLSAPQAPVLLNWKHQSLSFGAMALVFSALIIVASAQLQKIFHSYSTENAIRRETEKSLQKLSRAVEQSPVMVVITDDVGNIEYVNPKFTEVSGYSAEEVIGKNPKMLAAPHYQTTDFQEMWKALHTGKDWHGEFCNQRKDGSIYWESAAISSIKNDANEITHFLAIKEDTTNRKETEAQLELTAAVFETASEAIMVCDQNGCIQTVNKSFSEITGYAPFEAIGQRPSLLKSGRHGPSFYEEMFSRLKRYGHWEGEIWNRRKNGEIYPQWLSIKAIMDENKNIIRYISLFTDITLRKQNEQRILYQANYDALTGLPNRSLFMDRLQRAIVRAERSRKQIALLFIDLDRFKNVNDTLGHASGDLLLQEAARRLTALVRKSDTVARLGGDEFTVIISDLDDFLQIERLVESSLEQLSAPYDLDGNIAFVSASIGITIYPNDGSNVEELLKNADTAMYQAKESGRNLSQFFTNRMNDEANERRILETALHQALEREEFVLHYQPIVDLQTGHLTSCEVLLRWHQPEHGNVFPDKFIPLAEDTGLILPIGQWVLEQACREAYHWGKKCKNPPNVSINMSSRQFQRTDVLALVQKTLEKTGLDAHRLTLEITESLLIANEQKIITQLTGIRKLGVGLSIDDFGTGYSSLGYLRRFPISTLKIDRAFILDLTSDSEAAAVVSAILSMARSLNLKVVAEGVELPAQVQQLREGGCDFVQGYYYSPPVPIEAFRLMVQQKGPLQPDE